MTFGIRRAGLGPGGPGLVLGRGRLLGVLSTGRQWRNGEERGLPKELRKLTFSAGELQAAVMDYCLRTKIPVPKANIQDLVLSDDPEETVTIQFMPTEGQISEVKLAREQVAASLIRFCGLNAIPLPRNAQKVLQVQNGALSLMISMDSASRPAKE